MLNSVVANESMLVLTILEENQRNEIKIFSRKCNSIIKDGKLLRSEVKLTNTQLIKLKSVAKNKAGTKGLCKKSTDIDV